jgi:hypothetical protein
VQKVSEPVRIETIGAFQAATIASGFHEIEMNGDRTIVTRAQFTIRFRGQPVLIEDKAFASDKTPTRFERIEAVAALPGPEPALIVHAESDRGSAFCYLLANGGDRPRVEKLGPCPNAIEAHALTSDTARFRAVRHRQIPQGRIDRITFERGGLFVFEGSVLDTRSLTVHRFTRDPLLTGFTDVSPVAVSPDQRSFAQFAYSEGPARNPALGVTDFVANRSYVLPINPERTRFATLDELDPAWLDHHFEWVRGPDTVDHLIERTNFVPLPHHGQLSTEDWWPPGLSPREGWGGDARRDNRGPRDRVQGRTRAG